MHTSAVCLHLFNSSRPDLKAQHQVCMEVTQSQWLIPSSSYENLWISFWCFAYASIRITAGTFLASSDATRHVPQIFLLCS